MMGDFDIKWIDRKHEPQCAPNPAYPLGIDIDLSQGATKACKSELPYPAKRIGFYMVKCNICGLTTVITTAGRSDDPRSITLACGEKTQ
jgi:hypothetical protein